MFKKIIIGAIIIIVAVVVFTLMKQIIAALNVSDTLIEVAEDIHKAEIKNKELKRKLSEIKSLEFIEEQARNKLGLSKSGETLVIIPDEKIKEVLGASEAGIEQRLPNWLGWFRVFFR